MVFEVRHLEPFEGSGNAFPIFFQPPLAPILAWPQDLSKLRAFLSCLKCAGLILVKMPPGCRISKLEAITAASSEEAVSDRRSCATWGAVAGGHGKNPHKGEVRVQLPLPTLLLCPLAILWLCSPQALWGRLRLLQPGSALSNLVCFVPPLP